MKMNILKITLVMVGWVHIMFCGDAEEKQMEAINKFEFTNLVNKGGVIGAIGGGTVSYAGGKIMESLTKKKELNLKKEALVHDESILPDAKKWLIKELNKQIRGLE